MLNFGSSNLDVCILKKRLICFVDICSEPKLLTGDLQKLTILHQGLLLQEN